MKKTLLLLLLSLTFVTGSAYDYMINGLCYNLNEDGNTLTVVAERENRTPAYNSLSGDLVIPRMVLVDNRPCTVTAVGKDAFYGCAEITSITIGDGVADVGNFAFKECKKVTSVTFGRNVKRIGYNCFGKCIALTSIAIPSPVAILEGETFSGCKALTSVTLPSTLTVLGQGEFDDCSKLETIIGGENVVRSGRGALSDTKWFYNQPNGIVYFGKVALGIRGDIPETITIKEGIVAVGDYFVCSDYVYHLNLPSSLKEIGNHGFEACRNLNNVTFPANLEVIGEMAFDAAMAFTEVDIPDNVTTIGGNAFSRSSAIEKLTIGKGVTMIDRYAFTSCTGIKHIYSYPDPDDVTLGRDVFSYGPSSDCVLHVKSSLLEKYQTADQWKKFMPNIVGDLEDRPDVPAGKKGDVNGDNAVTATDISCIVNVLAGLEAAETYQGRADVNRDNAVTAADISSVVNILAGLE